MTDEEIKEIVTRCCMSSWTMNSNNICSCDDCGGDVTEEIKLEIQITEQFE